MPALRRPVRPKVMSHGSILLCHTRLTHFSVQIGPCSDLLSRHVNKCHASEKPPTTTAPNRRKGPTSASRATTSKQACDQCVQSSLPCDGCNPCCTSSPPLHSRPFISPNLTHLLAKCVSRKCRCTYVKFHRQTAPAGPGHPPPSQLLQHNSHSALAATTLAASHPALPSLSSTQFGIQYPSISYSQQYPTGVPGHSRTANTASGTEFLLNGPHAPGTTSLAAMGLPPSAAYQAGATLMDYPTYPGFSSDHQQRESPTPSLTASTSTASTSSIDNLSSPDMMARYRAQLEAMNRSGLGNANMPVSSNMNLQSLGMIHQGLYDQPGAASAGQREAWGGQSFHDAVAKDDSTGAPGAAGTAGGRGIPFPSVQTHPSAHNAADHHQSESQQGGVRDSSPRDRSEGGFSSAFGLMSLDDPKVLAGLANDGEPFFSAVHQRGQHDGSPFGRDMHLGDHPHHHHLQSDASSDASDLTAESSGTSGSHASSATSLSSFASLNFGSTGSTPLATREEVKEFWKQYMRTPLTGPGSSTNGLFGNLATPLASGSHLQLGHGHEAPDSTAASSTSPQRPGFGTPGRRHSRVNSLPSMKTPGVVNEWNLFAGGEHNLGGGSGNGGAGGSSNAELGFNTIPQPPPFILTLNPRRKTDASLSSSTNHHNPAPPPPPPPGTNNQPYASYHPTSKAAHHGDDDLRSYEQAVLARKAPTQLNLVPRRRGTIHLGAVGGGLQLQASQAMFQHQTRQAQEAQEAHSRAVDDRGRVAGGAKGGEGRGDSPTPSAADAMLGSQHAHDTSMSPPNVPASASHSSASASPTLGSYRPSFKRLASQTLAPENAKRALLGPAGWDDHSANPHSRSEEEYDEFDGSGSGSGSGSAGSELDGSEEDHDGVGAGERWARRRMSAPSWGRVSGVGVGVGSPVL